MPVSLRKESTDDWCYDLGIISCPCILPEKKICHLAVRGPRSSGDFPEDPVYYMDPHSQSDQKKSML